MKHLRRLAADLARSDVWTHELPYPTRVEARRHAGVGAPPTPGFAGVPGPTEPCSTSA
jgi:hypothetical protein